MSTHTAILRGKIDNPEVAELVAFGTKRSFAFKFYRFGNNFLLRFWLWLGEGQLVLCSGPFRKDAEQVGE